MSARATLLIAAVAGGVCLVLAGVMLAAILDRDRPGGTVKSIVTAAGIEIGGPFELIDHHGRAVTEASVLGSYLLVYFGFGYCPDVCPTELQNIGLAMDELGADAARVTPVFITVDPERDTVEFIKHYVAAFHPRMVGLTGDAQAIERIAKAYKVFYAKVDDEESSDYLMDHTSYVYLMGPDGKFVTMFRSNTPAADIAATIRQAF